MELYAEKKNPSLERWSTPTLSNGHMMDPTSKLRNQPQPLDDPTWPIFASLANSQNRKTNNYFFL
ncbi:unnamed protein product [Arabidopsis halleri]